MSLLRSLRFCAFWIGSLGSVVTLSEGATPRVEHGEIEGAAYTVLRPEGPWNKRLLLLAHGFRDLKAPLVADLSPEHAAYRTLVDEGWIVGKTSYRRNGLILADAIVDLDNLRAHIAAQDGAPTQVLLEGDSMGGTIVTMMAERTPGLYAGAVAVGAALSLQDPLAPAGLTLAPRIPLLFLTNQSELGGPSAYVSHPRPASPEMTAPVLFQVSRDGHVNVNQAERLVALRALATWIADGAHTLPAPAPGTRFYDATRSAPPAPSRVKFHDDHRGFAARVVEVSAIYGNVWLDAQPADFDAIGLARGAAFQLTAGAQTFRVVYGRDFNSVKKGDWVVFPNAYGFFWLARNSGSAADSARLKEGDPVELRRFESPAAR